MDPLSSLLESLMMGDHLGKTTLSLKVIFFQKLRLPELESALHIHRFCFLRFNQLQIEFCRLVESADMEPWMCRAEWTTNKKPVDLGTHGLPETTPWWLYYHQGQSSCNPLFQLEVHGHPRKRMLLKYVYTMFSRSVIYNLSSLDALWKHLYKKRDAKFIKSRHMD